MSADSSRHRKGPPLSRHRAEHRRPRRAAVPSAIPQAATAQAASPQAAGPQAAGRHRSGRAAARRSGVVWAAVGGMALVGAGVGVTLSTDTAGATGDVTAGAALGREATSALLFGGANSQQQPNPRFSRSAVRPSRDADRMPRPPAAAGGRSVAEIAAGTSGDGDAASRRPAGQTSQRPGSAASARSSGAADRRWVLPVRRFHVSTWFGESGWYWSSGYHTGIDLAAACGAPEVAVADARVVRAGWDGPYGYQVRLRLTNGDQVWYNHLTRIETRVGARVQRGDLVGLVGETGNAYGCHLHFEYRVRGDLKTAVDPAPYFAEHGIHLHVIEARRSRR